MNYQTGSFRQNALGSKMDDGTKIKETKVKTIIITKERFSMSNMGGTIATIITNGKTMETKKIGLGLMFLSKIMNLVLVKLEVLCKILRI